MLETLFGGTPVHADGRTVPVRLVGKQHVLEDLGRFPSFADWGPQIAPEAWMLKGSALDAPKPLAMGRQSVTESPRRGGLVNDATRAVRVAI